MEPDSTFGPRRCQNPWPGRGASRFAVPLLRMTGALENFGVHLHASAERALASEMAGVGVCLPCASVAFGYNDFREPKHPRGLRRWPMRRARSTA